MTTTSLVKEKTGVTESAGVKTVMNSFVSSGKDMMNAEDMFSAVHYDRGIRNTKASVLEIEW